MTLKPVLLLYPKVKIIVRCRLGRTKMFPLLRLFDIEPNSLNMDVLDDEFALISAPYAIMTLMGKCGYFMKNIAQAMQLKLSKLPSRISFPKNQILCSKVRLNSKDLDGRRNYARVN